MRLLLILAAIVVVMGCGGQPIDDCGEAVTGEDGFCVFGPSCAADTTWIDNGATDDNGFPVFACSDGHGRQVVDCVVRTDDHVALGLCR